MTHRPAPPRTHTPTTDAARSQSSPNMGERAVVGLAVAVGIAACICGALVGSTDLHLTTIVIVSAILGLGSL